MSNTVDERIVEMQFNNRQFESGVKESLTTIEKLKQGLNLNESAKNLANLQSAGDKFSLAGIANGVETIASKFSAFGIIGVTALMNIANAAINTGTQLIKSLTIDPIAEGYDDYTKKLTSVQTIMNATGESLPVVDGYFKELDTYADKTIYKLQDMTSAFAKFTNAGVDMDKSVPAIKGIANMVALAGQDANAASSAMYNLSQSISGGFLTTTDYKSLNLQNVATKEWKTNMADAAVAAGTLTKDAAGMYYLPGVDRAITMAGLFNDELSKGWATTDVMLKVFGDYADTTTDIGKKAQAAAQDVKSWGMMMETLSASVGTGWTDSFELIIGNVEESKVLFTGLTGFVQKFIDTSSDARNELLGFWKENGGREKLIQGIKDAVAELGRVLTPIIGVFKKVFPPVTGETVLKISNAISDFLSNVKMGDKDLTNLTKTAEGLFTGLKIIKDGVVTLAKILGIGLKKLGPVISSILEFTAYLSDLALGLDDSTESTDLFGKMLEKAQGFADTASAKISEGLNKIKEAFDSIKELDPKQVLENIKAFFSGIKNYDYSQISDSIKAAFDKIKEAFGGSSKPDMSGLDSFISGIKEKLGSLDKVIDKFNAIMTKAKGVLSSIGDFFKGLVEGMDIEDLTKLFQGGALAGVIWSIRNLITSVGDIPDTISGIFKSFKEIVDNVKKVTKGINDVLNGIKDSLKAFQQDIKAKTILKIAIAIGILALSIKLLASIDPAQLANAMIAMTTLFGELFGSLSVFSKTVNGAGFKDMTKMTIGLLGISMSMLLLAAAVKILATLDWQQLAVGLVGVGALLAACFGASKILADGSADMIKGAAGLILFAVAIGMLVSSVWLLGSMDPAKLALGLLGVLGLVGTLILMMKYGNLDANSLAMGAGLILVAIAMRLLVSSVKALGEMDPTQMAIGFMALIGILATLALFTKYVGDGANLITTGIGLMFLGVCILIISKAIEALGILPLEVLGKGLIGMGLALGAIVLAMKFMPPNMIVIGLGLLAVAAGLLLIAKAMQMIGGMSAEQVITAVTGLGIALALIVIAVNAMTGAIVGAAALVIVTVALLGIALVFQMLGTLSLQQIGIALLAIAGVLVIFGLAAMALTPALPSMLGLGAALILLGLGLMALGAASVIVSVGLAMLMAVGTAGVGVLTSLVTSIAPLILLAPGLVALGAGLLFVSLGITALGLSFMVLGAGLMAIVAIGPTGIMLLQMFVAMAVSVSKFAAQLLVAGAGLVVFGAGAVLAGTGAMLGGVGMFVLAAGLKALASVDLANMEGIQSLAEELFKASVTLLLAAPGLVTGGAGLLAFGLGAQETGTGLQSITTNIGDIIKQLKKTPEEVKATGDKILSVVRTMMDAINSTLLSKAPTVLQSVTTLCSVATSTIDSKRYMFVNSGINVVNGFIEGIRSRIDAAAKAAADMASKSLAAANKKLDINSPSKAFESTGKFSAIGLANGLTKYASVAITAAESLATRTLSPVMDMATAGAYMSSTPSMSTRGSSVSNISDNLQNGGPMQRVLSGLGDIANRNSENTPVDYSGTLTIQVVNDKGEVIGIAEKAIKDLLRRESR